jgi:hypothetical protein
MLITIYCHCQKFRLVISFAFSNLEFLKVKITPSVIKLNALFFIVRIS